mgnify:CR=1 FL=1
MVESQVIYEKRIALFIPNLHGGGAERATVNLLRAMSETGVPVDLVLASAEGEYLEQVPQQVRVVNLAVGRVIKSILPLANYLRKEKPFALISQMNHANVGAVVARELARVESLLVLVEQNTPSVEKSKLFRGRLVPPLMKLLYPSADVIVGVSTGVAQDLKTQFGIDQSKVKVIYNPVVDNKLFAQAKAPLYHPWFQEDSPPVFLAVGRLTEQKDFINLIKAFEVLRRQKIARLLILGEGDARNELEATITSLKLSEDVSLPGFVENPYAYMSRASAFVLSSRWEGLPTVLIEAMACGCPVIATDCPSGPREILAAGVYGSLIPVGDVKALSTAMLQVLETPVDRNLLLKRAMDFASERLLFQYLEILGYK